MRTRTILRLFAAVLLGTAGIAAVPVAAQAAMPLFQLPFGCGEQWRGGTGSSAHATPWEIDFNWGSGDDDLGKPVLAAAGGTIEVARYETGNGYGNRVVIRHGDSGYRTYYAHLRGFASGLSPGDAVVQGQLIGYVGNSSAIYTMSPHLHYEVRNSDGIQPAYFDGVRFGYPAQTITSHNCRGGVNGSGLRDVTGDGKSDLLAVNSDNYMHRYAGSGTGALTGTRLGPGWGSTRLITLADFTGDGNADMLAIRTDGSLYRYTGTGTGSFQPAVQIWEGGWGVFRLITSADFTGDGRADLVAVHSNGDLYRYNGNANGTVSRVGVVGSGWASMRLLTAADVDGDGRADLLSVHSNGDLYFYKGNGNGTVQPGRIIWDGGWGVFRLITAADYTSDGRADVLAVHTNGDLYRYNGTATGAVSRVGQVGHGWTSMRLINT